MPARPFSASRLPHQAREDVGFFSAALGVVARPAVLTAEESTLIPFLGASLLLQSFVSESGIIAVEQRALFGEGADLRELKQGGLARAAGPFPLPSPKSVLPL